MGTALVTVLLLIMAFSFFLASGEVDEQIKNKYLYMCLISQFTAVILVLIDWLLN